MPKYPENLIHFCRPVLEHYELKDEMGRMFVRSMKCLLPPIVFCDFLQCLKSNIVHSRAPPVRRELSEPAAALEYTAAEQWLDPTLI